MNEQHGFLAESKRPKKEEAPNLQKFGNYDLVRRIDVGGMGEVYLAHQRTAFGREVAVKIIRSDLVNDARARQRFLREAEVASYLKHDHILPLLEFGEEQGRLFIVTPYIKDGTLAQRLALGALPVSEVYELFSALCRAVSYLHKRGIVHRDLKPSNILLDKEEDSGRVYVRLIDFGIASSQGSPTSGALPSGEREFGTADYVAPERLRGVSAPSNDIYSLGVILHVMLTGTLPRADVPSNLPFPLTSVIDRCLDVDPDDRFTSVDDLLLAFEHAYKSLTTAQQMQPASPLPVESAAPALDEVIVPMDEDDESSAVPLDEQVAEPPSRPSLRTGRASPTSRPPLRASAVEGTAHIPSRASMGSEAASRSPVRRDMRDIEDQPTSRPPVRRDMRDIEDQPTARPVRRLASGEHAPLRRQVRRSDSGEQKVVLASSAADSRPPLRPRGASDPSLTRGTVLPHVPQRGDDFSNVDYDAPTTELDPKHLSARNKSASVDKYAQLQTRKPASAPKKAKRRRASPLIIISIFIIAILVVLGGIVSLIVQASITADVTISPKVQTVSSVFTFIARPGVKTADTAHGVIPASVLTSSKQSSIDGRPTGVSGCVLGIFECKETVSLVDISVLSARLRPTLKQQIAQDLHKQAQQSGVTTVGDIFYADGSITSNPTVGTTSKTMTVTMTEQGSIEYLKQADVQNLALQMLKRKVSGNYALIDTKTRVGQPVVQSVSSNGDIKVSIAASGISRYQISDSEMNSIKNHIKGMNLKQARTTILKDANLDPTTLSVRMSYGDTVPTNVQQIKITLLNPTNLPDSPLPAVPKPSGT
ncbi:serine/threonine protein kinase [Dictyobacter aurantiacus]|uniref:non-specific serine/threonine protein kinase n=1 Tax=Dictyobacter aurantiacus TaxID=1936993 RepID=A0A401ZDH5_9CHLR|nr:serine/threonine-protein kinase [Dictyobacter aurantiacus]GCE04905.1 hypothetical protein KDAU_22340 [Dictyobacter aurantiacus]